MAQGPNKAFHNFLEGLLPRKMVPVMSQRAEIPPDLPVNAMTRGQRRRLMEAMKAFAVPIAGPRPLFRRGSAGRGRLYRGFQPADRLVHRPGGGDRSRPLH